VNFKLPADIDAKKAGNSSRASAPKYRGLKGWCASTTCSTREAASAAAVYLWKSKADADAVYTPQCKAYIADAYGTPPEIRYFETSVVVDNESEKTILDAAA